MTNLAPVFRSPFPRPALPPTPRPTIRASRNPFRTWHSGTYYLDNLIIETDD